MVPYQIEFLVYICTRPWSGVVDNFPESMVWKDTLNWAQREGLLEYREKEADYVATPKAQALLDAMCSLPMPEAKWVIDWRKLEKHSGN